jgi:formylglycine-generating enzyme required for sulfatase activity
MKRGILLGLSCLFLAIQAHAAQPVENGGMVQVPEGKYLPFFGASRSKVDPKAEKAKEREEVLVGRFWMDSHAVTQAEFLKFVKKVPKWRRSKILPIFADSHYLASWAGDLRLSPHQNPNSPATEVSWFAAQAYCQSRGGNLPTVDQWEYAAADQGRGSAEAQRRILEWYSRPNSKALPVVGSAGQNGFGISDLHGLIWEWVLDFNNAMISEESRENGSTDGGLFCGSGSIGALDASDYASFMRYSFRSSLKASYTTANLGFRCVKGVEP